MGPMQTAAPPLPEDLETLRRQATEQAARLREYERQVAGQEQQIQDQDRHIEQLLDLGAMLISGVRVDGRSGVPC